MLCQITLKMCRTFLFGHFRVTKHDRYVNQLILSNELPLEKVFFNSHYFLHFRSYKSGSGVNNRRTELFLKEHEHLRK